MLPVITHIKKYWLHLSKTTDNSTVHPCISKHLGYNNMILLHVCNWMIDKNGYKEKPAQNDNGENSNHKYYYEP